MTPKFLGIVIESQRENYYYVQDMMLGNLLMGRLVSPKTRRSHSFTPLRPSKLVKLASNKTNMTT